MKESTDIYQLTKKVLTEGKIQYPAKAAYECFLTFNAYYWFTPDKCTLHYSNFGISVLPDFFNIKFHTGLILKVYKSREYFIREFVIENRYLPMQIYLHDLVMIKWEMEKDGFQAIFEIQAIRENEIITIS